MLIYREIIIFMAKRIIILHGTRNNNYNVFMGFKCQIYPKHECVGINANARVDTTAVGEGRILSNLLVTQIN